MKKADFLLKVSQIYYFCKFFIFFNFGLTSRLIYGIFLCYFFSFNSRSLLICVLISPEDEIRS